MIETDTAQAQGGFLLASGLGDDHDGLGAVEHRTRPGGVLPAQSDIDAAGEVALGILGGVADVEDLSARVSHPQDLVEIDGMENLFQILVQRGALASIQDGVVGEVRRRVGLVRRDQTNEFLLRHGLQGVIQTPLISERRDRVGGKLLPAKRAGAMGRIDQRLVGKRQEFVVERVVQVARRGRWRSNRAKRAGRDGRRRR